jgi:hypothetical protein
METELEKSVRTCHYLFKIIDDIKSDDSRRLTKIDNFLDVVTQYCVSEDAQLFVKQIEKMKNRSYNYSAFLDDARWWSSTNEICDAIIAYYNCIKD